MEAEIIGLVTGPLGALGLSVGLIIWAGKFVLPMLKDYLERQSAHLGNLIEALNKTVAEHAKDREAFAAGLLQLSVRVEKVETTLDSIAKKIL
jgi:uncharacterized coiled-coil protein SlyX